MTTPAHPVARAPDPGRGRGARRRRPRHGLPGGQRLAPGQPGGAGGGPAGDRRAGVRPQPGRPGAGHPADRLGRPGGVRVAGAGLHRAVLRRHRPGHQLRRCWRRPMQLWLAMAQSPAERERVEHHLTNQHVDGVLLLSLHDDDPLPTLLEERGLPTVLGGRPARMLRPGAPAGAASSTWTTSAAPGRRWSTCSAGAPAGRDHRRAAGHGRRPGPAGRLPGGGARPPGAGVDPGLIAYGDFSEGSGAAAHAAAAGRLTRTWTRSSSPPT